MKGLRQIPQDIFEQYKKAALEKARLEQLSDGTWYAEIPGFPGVWANDRDKEKCRQVLAEVLEEWLALKIQDGDDDIPVVGGINLLSFV